MKILLFKILSPVLLLLLFAGKADAYTFEWNGTSATWTSASSWTRSGSGGTSTYPGQSGSADIVNIGITAYTSYNPILSSSVTVASITFGVNGDADMTLTVNTGVLSVSGDISIDHLISSKNTQTFHTITLTGTGTIICQNFNLGDTTQPAYPNCANVTILSSQVGQLTINGDLILTSVGNKPNGINYPLFDLDNNNMTLKGQFKTVALSGPDGSKNPGYLGYGSVRINTTTNTTQLELQNATPVSSTFDSNFVIDFNYGAGTASTVLYDAASGNQTVYTCADIPIVDISPQTYDNLMFSGASTKKVNGCTLSVGGNWTSGGGAVDLKTNSTVTTVAGNWTNSATTTQGFGNISVTGNVINSGTLTLGTGSLTIAGNYTNSGTYTQNTGYTVFNGMGQTLTDSGNGTMFNNVFFNGNGGPALTDVISSGNFSVSSTGVLNMVNATYLNANGHLTLNSDVNSSATVAAIPAGAGITGNVNVQRFIQGSSSSTAKRGYRAISSAVYTGTVSGGVNVFDVKYLLNSALVSGLNGTANGFNITTANNNSTLYLFREDDNPPPSNSTQFLTGYNWKGIAKLNNSPTYNIGTQKRLTTTNLADTTTTIPVGNGVLFFFRGNSTLSNGTTGGTKTTSPFNYPEDVTTTQVGALNTGTINVKLWFANTANGLGSKFSYTSGYVNSGTSYLRGGFTFVGNPYAATVNWEKYNRNSTIANSSIYGGGSLGSTIWIFNEANNQYESYIQKTGAVDTTSVNPGTATGSASNMIASGQGFFIVATTGNQSLSFRETAKTSSQPVAATLHNLMGMPKAFAATPDPLLRLKLLKDSVNTDEIVIRLDKQASTKFVFNEDAQDMGGIGPLVSLSAISSDNIRLAIDFMPFPGLQQEVTPLLVDATTSGTYKLDRTQLDNLPAQYDVWLIDAFAKDSINLKTTNSYSFTIGKNNPATFGEKRFSIVFRQSAADAYQLLDFTATKVPTARQVQMAWKTANEQNYTNFTVERSTDGGKTFGVVGGLKGTGAGIYSLLDKEPLIGQNLYRLKQEDMNDSITYSKAVGVQYADLSNTMASKLSIYPNPATSNINVSVVEDAGTNPLYTIQITNTSGFLIRQVTSAQPSWQTSVADLMPGTYIVKVHNSRDNTIIGDTKFVKL